MSDQSGRTVPREPIQTVAEKTGASHDAGTITLSFRNSAGEVVSVQVEKAEAEKLLQMLQRPSKPPARAADFMFPAECCRCATA